MQAFVNSLVGWVVFKFLTDADVGYLDLETPKTKKIMCLAGWPLRYEGSSWIEQDAWTSWSEILLDQKAYIDQHECSSAVSIHLSNVMQGGCDKVNYPASALQRSLGLPLGRDINSTGDVITVGATWFLYLGLCLWFTTTVHDLALTSVHNHNDVLDLMGIRNKFPRFIRFSGWLIGYRPWKMMKQGSKALKIIAWVLLPFFTIWGLAMIALVWWPCAGIVYLFHPISLSRGAVFVNAVLFVLYGLAMTICGLVFIADADVRPMYAVTWETPVSKGGDICACGCTYNISANASISFTLIGVSVVWKAFIIGFRCLKGLRRSNWANLLTVMFPVPLNIYPVEWTQPDGSPIQHRTEQDPVQGELAFDPFALMDEQPESAQTILYLRPQPREEVHHNEKEVEGPVSTVRSKENEGRHVAIGCCGFPYWAKKEKNEPELSSVPEESEEDDPERERGDRSNV